jgi:hypothetical protein
MDKYGNLVKLNLSIENGISSFRIQDKLEDTKWVIKGRNAKHIQYNGIQKRGQKAIQWPTKRTSKPSNVSFN